MRKLTVFAVIACVIGLATTAEAQLEARPAVGIAVSVTSEDPGTGDVDIDVTLNTYYNYNAGSDMYGTAAIGNLWRGSVFYFFGGPGDNYANFDTATFQAGPTTYIDCVDPGLPAVDWRDGADIDDDTIAAVGGGNGEFRGSFSHSFADNFTKTIRVAVSSPWLSTGEPNYPTTGDWDASVNGAPSGSPATMGDWWGTDNPSVPDVTCFRWNADNTTDDLPMGISNTDTAFPGNPGGGGTPIPTLSWLGMLIMAVILAGTGIVVMMRR